ncbi:MAG: FAD-dependent oxidoreductase [Candidatus Nanopelagicales bacterium]|nr:FAD-dependent oxidoreductase [Candidatus Nanopelagicales bacterium]
MSTKSLTNVRNEIFWFDDRKRPAARPHLESHVTADLCVVGGGFSGLWTAVLAKQEHPDWDVVLLEGDRIASGATGRNGGFCAASLTHGLDNGMNRWPGEMPTLLRLGRENLDAIELFVAEHGIDCEFVRSGDISVATQAYQVASLEELYEMGKALGVRYEWLDQTQLQSRVVSPTYLAALADSAGTAMLNPAKLAWGLARVAGDLGVRIYEYSPVMAIKDKGETVSIFTRSGSIAAERVALATNAYPPLLRRVSNYVVPVYDYVLMTQKLTPEQRDLIHWEGREGLSDCGNQFHYYRITEDGRILWGGYDAVYHRGNGFGKEFEVDAESFQRLAAHFFQTFPQLAGLEFTHAWGGAIDTCSRFSAFWGKAHGGKTAYVSGYTGLGVGSSRFGAQVMLDLLHGRKTERTELQMVKKKPKPFPPEPVRSIGIDWTTRSLQSADQNAGHRNLWLRTLDRFGFGFDS